MFMAHPWFTLDYEDLILRQIEPPFQIRESFEASQQRPILDFIQRMEIQIRHNVESRTDQESIECPKDWDAMF
jgi:hypothetical protein